MLGPLIGRRKVGAGAAFVLSGLLVLGLAPVRSSAATDDGVGRRRQMLGLTNDDRSARDRAELRFAARLSHYAKSHSEQMAKKGYIYHSREDQLRDALKGYDWSLGGENVGVGGSLESLESAFMASRDHRENILRREFDHAAFGIYRTDGRVWITVIFYG